ncbi:MAG: Uma2 family endonuclease [Cyanophyceae cyanobacterium]
MVTVKRFTVDEYHRLTELGLFQEDDRVELISGEIIEMAAKGTPHRVCCTRLLRELSTILKNRATLQCQDPITVSARSEPEPDLAIVKNREDDYLSGHPSPQDVLLVIEIADSFLEYDREVKLPLYAEAGIENYWIFNLKDKQLEASTDPYQTARGDFNYRQKQIYLPNQQVALPTLSGLLPLNKIFPEKTLG